MITSRGCAQNLWALELPLEFSLMGRCRGHFQSNRITIAVGVVIAILNAPLTSNVLFVLSVSNALSVK